MDARLTKRGSRDWTATCFMALMIVFIVVGHVPSSSGFAGPFDLFPLYSFHVAAFCFVSGYLYSERHDAEPMRYVAGRVHRLLIPMLAIYAIYGVLRQILASCFGFSFGVPLSLESVFVMPFTHGAQFGLNYAMWFIAPFFLAQCLWVLARACVIRLTGSVAAADGAVLIAAAVAGGFAVGVGGTQGLPPGCELMLCRTVFLSVWLAVGRAYRVYAAERDTMRDGAYLCAVCAAQLGIWWLCGGGSCAYTPGWCVFPNGTVLTYLATLTGIAFWWRVCRIVAPRLGATSGKAVALVGDNTFSIMCHHLMGFFIVKCLFYVGHELTPAFGLFDVASFFSNSDYFYFPHNLHQFGLVCAAVGICFSLGVHGLWVRVKEGVRRRFRSRAA